MMWSDASSALEGLDHEPIRAVGFEQIEVAISGQTEIPSVQFCNQLEEKFEEHQLSLSNGVANSTARS